MSSNLAAWHIKKSSILHHQEREKQCIGWLRFGYLQQVLHFIQRHRFWRILNCISLCSHFFPYEIVNKWIGSWHAIRNEMKLKKGATNEMNKYLNCKDNLAIDVFRSAIPLRKAPVCPLPTVSLVSAESTPPASSFLFRDLRFHALFSLKENNQFHCIGKRVYSLLLWCD